MDDQTLELVRRWVTDPNVPEARLRIRNAFLRGLVAGSVGLPDDGAPERTDDAPTVDTVRAIADRASIDGSDRLDAAQAWRLGYQRELGRARRVLEASE